MIERADDIGGATAHGDANHDVQGGETDLFEIAPALVTIILGAFNGISQGAVATRDQADDHAFWHTEGRWALRGIKNAQPAAGAGAHIDQPRPSLEGRHDTIHCRCDLGYLLLDGVGNLGILGIHRRQNFCRRHEVDMQRCGVAGLRDELPQLGHQNAFCHGNLMHFSPEMLGSIIPPVNYMRNIIFLCPGRSGLLALPNCPATRAESGCPKAGARWVIHLNFKVRGNS